MSSVNKVDMSLDDIIKLNKRQKTSKSGRGKLKQSASTQRVKQFHTNLKGAKNVRGQGRGGTRGQNRGQSRGTRGQVRGRGASRGGTLKGRGSARGQGTRGGRGRLSRSSGVSPLNRSMEQPKALFTKGQGRARANMSNQRIQAVNALRKAKQQLANIDAQSTKRQNTFNERRGLQTQAQPQSSRGRGRGRGRKLNRQNLTTIHNTTQSANIQNNYPQGATRGAKAGRGRGRGTLRRSGGAMRMDIIDQSPNVPKKKRQWRRKSVEIGEDNDGIMTISLPNTDYRPIPREVPAPKPKPKPRTSINYNPQIFARSGGNSSLSNRFEHMQGDSDDMSDRQVFL